MEADYRVELDNYSGPLDLLLFLVRRHEIDLHDIPIAELTNQYIRHLEMLKQIDVNLAGEFLVMAATLLEIKSAMLLPQPADDADAAGEQVDPRFELVQQLLAYKRFKDAAMDLDDRRQQWQTRFSRRPGRLQAGANGDDVNDDAVAPTIELDLEDVHILDLAEAFVRILDSIGEGPVRHEVIDDDTPITLHADDIVDRLKREGPLTLQAMFVGRANRIEMIGLFLATLELVRQGRVKAVQLQLAGEIQLELVEQAQTPGPPDTAPPDWRDPQTGQVQYDWPSEEARQRAERRAKRKLERGIKETIEQSDDDDDLILVDADDDEQQ